MRQLLPKMFASLRGMLAEFSETEQVQLISQLRRLQANLAEGHKEPEQ